MSKSNRQNTLGNIQHKYYSKLSRNIYLAPKYKGQITMQIISKCSEKYNI